MADNNGKGSHSGKSGGTGVLDPGDDTKNKFDSIMGAQFSPEDEAAMEEAAVHDGSTTEDAPALQPVDQVYDDEPAQGAPGSGGEKPKKDTASESDLSDAENAGAQKDDTKPEKQEAGQVDKAAEQGKEFAKKNLKPQKAASSGKPLFMLGGIIGSVVLMFGVFVLIMALIGPLKGVHFSQVLGSTGFAVFQRSVSAAYTQFTLDKAIYLEGNRGSIHTGNSGFSTRRLAELGRSGQLKWLVGEGGKVSLAMQGTNGKTGLYSIDETARAISGRDYSDLSVREKWYVRSQFSKIIRNNLTRIPAIDKLSYRTVATNALRRNAGTYMFRWQDKASEYFGKSPTDAAKLGFRDRVRAVLHRDYTPPPRTGTGGALEDEVQRRAELLIEANEKSTSYRNLNRAQQKAIDINNILTGGLVKNVSNIVLISTIYCVIQYLDQTYMEAQGGKEVGAARLLHDNLTVSEQIEAGEATSIAINEQNSSLDGGETAAAYQLAMGNATEEAYMAELAAVPSIYDDNRFFEVIGALANVSPTFGIEVLENAETAACAFVMDEAVQWTIAGVEIAATIFSGGAARIASGSVAAVIRGALSAGFKVVAQGATWMTAGWMLGTFIDNQIQSLSGEAYTGTINGADGVNQAHAAAKQTQANFSRSYTYAAPVSREESIGSTLSAQRELREYYNNGSFSERYFAVTNPYSLLGRTAAQMPTTMTGLFGKITGFVKYAASLLASPFQLIGGAAGIFRSAPVSAAAEGVVAQNISWAGVDVGVTEYMWTDQDLAEIAQNPDYYLGNLEETIEPRLDELIAQYKINECFVNPVMQSALPEYCKDTENEIFTSEESRQLRWFLFLKNLEEDQNRELSEFSSSATAPATTTAGAGGNVVGTGDWYHPNGGNTSHGWTFWSESKYGINGTHAGIDFHNKGKSVFAACDGTVSKIQKGAEDDKNLPFVSAEHTSSNFVVITCGSSYGPYEAGYHHTYASVNEGDTVSAGDVVGITDNSGISFGAHLHFTIKNTNESSNSYKGFVDPTTVITDPKLY